MNTWKATGTKTGKRVQLSFAAESFAIACKIAAQRRVLTESIVMQDEAAEETRAQAIRAFESTRKQTNL